MHPEGYDLCTNCVEMQVNFDFQQAQAQAQAQGQVPQQIVQGAEALVGKAFKAIHGFLNKKVQPQNAQNVQNVPNANANPSNAPSVPELSVFPQSNAAVPPADVPQGEISPLPLANAAEEKQQDEGAEGGQQGQDVVVISDEADKEEFAYPSQLRYIMDMKFQHADEATVKFLLIKHKGDANQVINQIINQAP
jgi:hypothetical protein